MQQFFSKFISKKMPNLGSDIENEIFSFLDPSILPLIKRLSRKHYILYKKILNSVDYRNLFLKAFEPRYWYIDIDSFFSLFENPNSLNDVTNEEFLLLYLILDYSKSQKSGFGVSYPPIIMADMSWASRTPEKAQVVLSHKYLNAALLERKEKHISIYQMELQQKHRLSRAKIRKMISPSMCILLFALACIIINSHDKKSIVYSGAFACFILKLFEFITNKILESDMSYTSYEKIATLAKQSIFHQKRESITTLQSSAETWLFKNTESLDNSKKN